MMGQGMYGNGPYPNQMGPMFPHKSGSGDSQNPPLWNPNRMPAPTDHGDNEVFCFKEEESTMSLISSSLIQERTCIYQLND